MKKTNTFLLLILLVLVFMCPAQIEAAETKVPHVVFRTMTKKALDYTVDDTLKGKVSTSKKIEAVSISINNYEPMEYLVSTGQIKLDKGYATLTQYSVIFAESEDDAKNVFPADYGKISSMTATLPILPGYTAKDIKLVKIHDSLKMG
ncbi:MAG: hypothetical protein K6F37_07190, partial [Lachnospiraceae bacterium]|nr:hypothetical protein [Lachnospiraceae bacterium]